MFTAVAQLAGPAFGLCLVLFFIVFAVRRCLYRLRHRGDADARFCPGYGSMGNAFQVLQTMVEPEVAYILQEKQEEEADEEDDGAPDDPGAFLEKQLRRIRNGEQIDRLQIRMR